MKAFVHETPCVRTSLINGIIGGAGLGVGSFLYSKRVKRSCDAAVGGFLFFSLVSWTYCYYHRVIQLNNLQKIVDALENSNKMNCQKATELKTSNQETS